MLQNQLRITGNIQGNNRKFRKFIFNQIYKIKKRIVGNDDGGITFTPEEYERYKKEVLPMVNI
jgi:hypothetical protein